MEKDEMILICSCHSFEHMVHFWWCEEDKVMYVHTHLTTYRNFFKRLWVGLRYAFGYKSRFGEWDSCIFDDRQLKALRDFIQKNTPYDFNPIK
jgi:hypothetical protein